MRRTIRPLLAALALPLLAGLTACLDADTLGDEPPTVVAVDDPPTWDAGVGTLMQLKCGVCHAVPRPPIAPLATPTTFDLNHHMMSPTGVPGATYPPVPQCIIEGILRNNACGSLRMPLEYATPLVELEIQALEDWAAGGGL